MFRLPTLKKKCKETLSSTEQYDFHLPHAMYHKIPMQVIHNDKVIWCNCIFWSPDSSTFSPSRLLPMIVQFMDKHAINLRFSRVGVDFSIECSRSESMLSIFNSLQAKARKYPFSTVISFLGLLSVGRQFIKANK